jgi:hypothetical protein
MERSMLGGQWNVPSLVANGRFHAWWPMECSKLGGQWKVKEKHLFTSSIFPLTTLLKPSIFSFDLTVLLYHVSKSLLTSSLPFFRSINYNCAPQCNKSFTPSLSIWFWLRIWPFSSPWNYGVTHGHILQVASHTSEWRIAFRIISRSYPNTASSRWRTRTSRSVCSSWSWTPSSLVLSYFSELSHLRNLATSQPRF